MANCPAGHASASSDFCDVCGMRIGDPASRPAARPADLPPEARPSVATRPAVRARPCPRCGEARSGQFCERCGFDFEAAQSPAAAAAASNSEATAKLLAKVVDVVDPALGTVKLKMKVEGADEKALDTRSTKTVRVRK